MEKLVASAHFEIKGSDLKRLWREAKEFEADRVNDHGERVAYMAHSAGWVMVRKGALNPFAVPERDWRALPLWVK